MTSTRTPVCAISAAAFALFFLFSQPHLALTAGGIVLSGLSLLLIGLLPEGHPPIRGPFFGTARLWIIGAGAFLLVSGLLVIALNRYLRCCPGSGVLHQAARPWLTAPPGLPPSIPVRRA